MVGAIVPQRATLMLAAIGLVAAMPTAAAQLDGHLVQGKVQLSISPSEFGRDELLVTRVLSTGWTAPGPRPAEQISTRLVRWQRVGDRVLLVSSPYDAIADSAPALERAVAAASAGAVLGAFAIKGTDTTTAAVLIDVTTLFTTSIPEVVAISGPLDGVRSFPERVTAFTDNLDVDGIQTTVLPTTSAAAIAAGANAMSTVSIAVRWSFVRLPSRLMQRRRFDSRVGFASVNWLDFGKGADKAESREAIVRYALQKADPKAPISDPVKPIVFYLDPATPAKWVPWIKKGVEEWQAAFTAAGFSHAIVAKDAPTENGNGPWSPDDIRFSVIRWLPSTIETGDIVRVEDPRTGEVLNAQIHLFHNVTHQQRDWYITQAGGVDARAWLVPFPDSIMGRLLQRVVAHEVGHALGLVHNFKASSLYPVDSIRSRSWVHRMGHAPSIMDYVRFNYVAQPEDKIDLGDLVPRVGPSDIFAIAWGYALIEDSSRPGHEQRVLDSLARVAQTTPWLRFGGSVPNGADPSELTEAVGDADPVRATQLGFQNLRRILTSLRVATPSQGWDSSRVGDVYRATVRQWTLELGHVTALVAGVEPQYDGAVPFKAVGRDRQRDAVRFVVDNGLLAPFVLTDPIAKHLEPVGSLQRIQASQVRILGDLISDARLSRLLDLEFKSESPTGAYSARELLKDVRGQLWAEADGQSQDIDAVRRGAQRAYVSLLKAKVAPDAKGAVKLESTRCMSDLCAIVRSELSELATAIGVMMTRPHDKATVAHLRELQYQLREVDVS